MTDAASKSDEALIQLRDCLADRLRHEGFSSSLPVGQQPSRFNLGDAEANLLLWCLCALMAFCISSFSGVSIDILYLGMLLLGVLLWYVLPSRIAWFPAAKNLRVLDFILGIGLGVLVNVYTRSLGATVWFVLFYSLLHLIYWPAVSSRHRVLLLKALRITYRRVFPQSISFTFTLAPILITLLLLSEFSQELWQAVAAQDDFTVIVSSLWIVLPVLIGVFGIVIRAPRQIVPQTVSMQEVENHPCYVKFVSGWIQVEHQEIVNRIQTRIEDPLASKRLATLIERVVRTELGLVFYFMNIALASVFFAYFSVLFNLLLDDSVIRLWIGNTYFLPKLALFGQEFYDPFSGPVSNVTIFFSIMTAGIANVQIVADEQRRKDLIRFSSERATRLMGMSALLRAVNQELSNKPTAANNAAK